VLAESGELVVCGGRGKKESASSARRIYCEREEVGRGQVGGRNAKLTFRVIVHSGEEASLEGRSSGGLVLPLLPLRVLERCLGDRGGVKVTCGAGTEGQRAL
jgi:hypothetical protein